jgi:hypothetical protein
MDMHDGNNQLWVIDSAGWITQCTNACPPIAQNSWNTGLPITGNWVTSAIAIDELRGLVFYSTCNFGMGQGQIYVAPLANPGAWFQSSPVFDCLPVPTLITGMAIDAANSALYWTTGRGTNRWTYTYNPAGPSVAFTPGTCCLQIAPLPDPYTDLSIRWGGATPSGGPCANGACAPCPNVHVLRKCAPARQRAAARPRLLSARNAGAVRRRLRPVHWGRDRDPWAVRWSVAATDAGDAAARPEHPRRRWPVLGHDDVVPAAAVQPGLRRHGDVLAVPVVLLADRDVDEQLPDLGSAVKSRRAR